MSDVQGTIKVIGETQVVSEKFSKREFVLTTGEQYPQHLPMQLTQAKCDLLDGFKIGDEIKVYYNLRGREWTNKEGKVQYFGTTEVWKIEKIGSHTETNVSDGAQAPTTGVEEDSLPF